MPLKRAQSVAAEESDARDAAGLWLEANAPPAPKTRVCECGCGMEYRPRSNAQRFINSHSRRVEIRLRSTWPRCAFDGKPIYGALVCEEHRVLLDHPSQFTPSMAGPDSVVHRGPSPSLIPVYRIEDSTLYAFTTALDGDDRASCPECRRLLGPEAWTEGLRVFCSLECGNHFLSRTIGNASGSGPARVEHPERQTPFSADGIGFSGGELVTVARGEEGEGEPQAG